jgi:hypothetical protein
MAATRLALTTVACLITTTTWGGIYFSVVPSQKPPYIRTPTGGYRLSDDQPPDPHEVAVRITADGAERFHRAVWSINVDPDALPKGVHWVESQGSPDEMYHYFQITRAHPFRLRRQDFYGLPDWVQLPKIILKPRETPNQAMELTTARITFTFSMTKLRSLRAPLALAWISSNSPAAQVRLARTPAVLFTTAAVARFPISPPGFPRCTRSAQHLPP